jgi:hypothetical protein
MPKYSYKAKIIRSNILYNLTYIVWGNNFAFVHRIYDYVEYILLTSSEKNNEHQDKWRMQNLKGEWIWKLCILGSAVVRMFSPWNCQQHGNSIISVQK